MIRTFSRIPLRAYCPAIPKGCFRRFASASEIHGASLHNNVDGTRTLYISTEDDLVPVPFNDESSVRKVLEAIEAETHHTNLAFRLASNGVEIPKDSLVQDYCDQSIDLQISPTEALPIDTLYKTPLLTFQNTSTHLQITAVRNLLLSVQADALQKFDERHKALLLQIINSAIKNSFYENDQQIHAIQSELSALKKKKKQLDALQELLGRKSQSTVKFWAWGAVGLLGSQFAGIAYGTYWLYSWDVMEPITFLLGFFNACVGSAYFAISKKDFSGESFTERLVRKKQERLYKKHNYNVEDHAAINERIHHLEFQKKILLKYKEAAERLSVK